MLVNCLREKITTARMIAISRRHDNRPNGVSAVLLASGFLAMRSGRRPIATPAVLVVPNANCCPCFEMEFLQNVLHVFLHGARAASENFADLVVAFAGRDPFHHFELPRGKRTRPFGISGRRLVYFG